MPTQKVLRNPTLLAVGALILAGMVAIVLFFAALCGSDRVLVTDSTAYAAIGQFQLSTKDLPVKRSSTKAIRSYYPDALQWESWAGGNPNAVGQLVSPSFKAPAILSVYVAGWLHVDGNGLFLKRTDTGEELPLRVGNVAGRWEEVQWWLPYQWQGRSVQLVAKDGNQTSAGWIGVTSPIQTSLLQFVLHQLKTLLLVPLYALQFALFFVVGLLPAVLISRRSRLNPAFVLILAVTISAFVGYLTFWVYFFNHIAGIVFSSIILLVSVWKTAMALRQESFKKLLTSVDIWIPGVLMLLLGVAYTAFLYSIHPGEAPETLPQVRFFSIFPPDNVLPKIFADRLYEGKDPRPLLGEWLSSDRPPLQTGIVLLQYPLMKLLEIRGGFYYQFLGTIAQCSWVAALWSLCRVIGCSGKQIAIVLSFCIYSSFFLFHSIYVWPKMLAGSLVLFAFVLLVQSLYESRRPTTVEIGLATGATALGMLAHGGVVFVVPAIALMVLLRIPYLPTLRQVVLAFLVLGIFLTPWGAYQKLYEPPGDRLVKWHIGGVVNVDPRPAKQAIVESYSHMSLAQIAANKWENVKIIAGDLPKLGESAVKVRDHEFFSLVRTLGVLNIGWLVLPFAFLIKPLRQKVKPERITVLLAVALSSIVFWVLIMFGPGTTSVQSASYTTVLLLFTGLSLLVSGLPPLFCYGLLAFQAVCFTYYWIIATTFTSDNYWMVAPNVVMVATALVAFSLVMAMLYHLSKLSFLIKSSGSATDYLEVVPERGS